MRNLKQLRGLTCVCLSMLSTLSCIGQDFVAFTQKENFSTRQSISYTSKFFADFNGDFRDDLGAIDISGELEIYLPIEEGHFFWRAGNLQPIDGDSWTISIGDINNDNFNDLLTAGNQNGVSTFNSQDYDGSIELSQSGLGNFFAQSSNLVDIDNDGWLDAFVCNDDGLSFTFMNDGTGQLQNKLNVINMETIPVSDNSGNYASEWTDIDGDNDLDLYIAKCRINVNSTADPRRINQLFINNNGVFEEMAAPYGLANGNQTWTCNFGDFDNDGDPDLFMIQHGQPLQLFENINGIVFLEKKEFIEPGAITTEGYQSGVADFNNDGFLDILVGGVEDYLFLNKGDFSFSVLNDPFGLDPIYSFALGDYNEDGFTDVFASYQAIEGTTEQVDKLFTNIGNGNNYFGLSLRGNTSNRSGIGATVKLYGDWGMQTRVIQSGTGYGVTNSLTARFGLKDFQTVDSLIVLWPSGELDKHLNPDVNTQYVLYESSCFNKVAQIKTSSETIDCINPIMALTVENVDYDSIFWKRNGITSTDTSFHSTTFYNYALLDEDSTCPNATSTIFKIADFAVKPAVNIINDPVLCPGEEFTIESFLFGAGLDDKESFWQDESFSETFKVSETGLYFSYDLDECDTLYSDTISVTVAGQLQSDTFNVLQNNIAKIFTDLPLMNWYSDKEGLNLIEVSDTLFLNPQGDDTIVYGQSAMQITPPMYMQPIHAFYPLQSVSNYPLELSIHKNARLYSFGVYSEIEGERRFIIQDANEDIVDTKTVFLTKDTMNEVVFDLLLAPGKFIISTDEDINQLNFNEKAPQLSKNLSSASGQNYEIGPVATVSNFTRETIYFNIKISETPANCTFPIIPFLIQVIDPNAVQTVLDFDLEIFPNPSSETLNIKSDKQLGIWKIYNTQGQLMYQGNSMDDTIEVDILDLPSGIYFLNMAFEGHSIIRKFIKE